MRTRQIHIGTSGWHYKHWTGSFYPKEIKDHEQLNYYQQHFHTVELNNSFYRLPTPETFNNWANAVPADFLFAIKGNRYVTHMKKLNVAKSDLRRFFRGVYELEKKAGPVLYQLPPNWKVNTERLDRFLGLLPEEMRFTFEFRNPSWYSNEVYDVLKKYNCAFCIYELAGHNSPRKITADFVYVRLHGPGDKYQGKYPMNTLKEWAARCLQWQRLGKDVFIYFDNDEAGYAPANARQLDNLVNAT